MGISRAERRDERRPRVLAAFFGEVIADPVLDLLELAELSWHDCYDEVTLPEQVIDDLLFCSGGDIAMLIRLIRLAVTDRRDFKLMAEQARTRPKSSPIPWRSMHYCPIEIPVPLEASMSDLVAFRWETSLIAADFLLPGDSERAIRVTFDKPCIVRIVDEMPLSTENDGRPEGLVSNHFAYRVEGSGFVEAQSWTWKYVFGPVTHYRFITGWACLDVISSAQPSFTVIEHSSAKSA
jgi:hypothetical protein